MTKSILNSRKKLFLGPTSLLVRDRNEGRPQGLKSGWHKSLVRSGHKILGGQRVEQVLLIDKADRKGENGDLDVGNPNALSCCCLAESIATADLLLWPYDSTSNEFLMNRDSITHVLSIDL